MAGTGHKMKTYSSEASQSFAHSPTPPFFHGNAAIQSVPHFEFHTGNFSWV